MSEVEVPYIEEPTIRDLLAALPRDLSTRARLTLLVFWEDANRCSGPTEITVPQVQRLTGLGWGAQQKAILELRRAKILTESRRYRFNRGSVWIRFVKSPLVISPEGRT